GIRFDLVTEVQTCALLICLHSIVTRFGMRGAFAGARLSHAATVACLAGAGLGLSVGVLYWSGVAVVAVLLGYEHSLVRSDDLSRSEERRLGNEGNVTSYET